MPSESVEDYLEAIYTMVKKKGYARTTDIKNILSHSAASVTEMFQKLDRDGYVNYEKYGGVTLTDDGMKIAREVSKRHKVLTRFLEILGIPEDIAEEDACRIEHSVHDETVKLLTNFVEFVQTFSESPKWLEHFREFTRTGDVEECRKLNGCHDESAIESNEISQSHESGGSTDISDPEGSTKSSEPKQSSEETGS